MMPERDRDKLGGERGCDDAFGSGAMAAVDSMGAVMGGQGGGSLVRWWSLEGRS